MSRFWQPMEVKRMHWDQLRSHNTAENAPWNAIPAVACYIDDEDPPVQMFPSAIGYNKWQRKWGSPSFAPSARQVASLDAGYTQQNPYQPVPFQTLKQVSAPLNRLPSLTHGRYWDNPEPISRDVLDRPNLVDAPTLRALANVMNNPTENNNFEQNATIQYRRFPSTYVFNRR